MSGVEDPEIARLRREIDALDTEIVRLLNERARRVVAIGAVKRSLGRPVYDPERERRILERVREEGPGPLTPEAVRRLYERILDESRRLERVAVEEEEGGREAGPAAEARR